jgi:agmatine deiminase
MLWPERPDNWRNGGKPAQRAFAAVGEAIATAEPVTVCCSREQYPHARAVLSDRIRVVEMSSNDAWIRDCGPTFVVNRHGDVRGVDWKFNAWGGMSQGLYFPWDQDDLVGTKVVDLERQPRYAPDIVMEGGSIDVDGQGTLLATEECLLNPNRNPNLGRDDITMYLREYLDVEQIIWLPNGVYLDETNGHVDNLARFFAPGHVMLTWTDDTTDPQHAISLEAEQVLKASVDTRGRPLTVVRIHQPEPVIITREEATGVDAIPGSQPRTSGERLAASYVNSYIANDAVIVPGFDDNHDQAALDTYARLFPRRRIIQVPGREILLGGGGIHCITQQQPLARGNREHVAQRSRSGAQVAATAS